MAVSQAVLHLLWQAVGHALAVQAADAGQAPLPLQTVAAAQGVALVQADLLQAEGVQADVVQAAEVVQAGAAHFDLSQEEVAQAVVALADAGHAPALRTLTVEGQSFAAAHSNRGRSEGECGDSKY